MRGRHEPRVRDLAATGSVRRRTIQPSTRPHAAPARRTASTPDPRHARRGRPSSEHPRPRYATAIDGARPSSSAPPQWASHPTGPARSKGPGGPRDTHRTSAAARSVRLRGVKSLGPRPASANIMQQGVDRAARRAGDLHHDLVRHESTSDRAVGQIDIRDESQPLRRQPRRRSGTAR